jgi:hypothetical protein
MPVVVNYPPPSSVVVNEVTGAVTVVQSGKPGPQGIQGVPGVVTATSPATYDAPTQTVGVDQTAIAIQPSQVAGTAVVDNDARLTDARTPTAHAASHASAGSDALTLTVSQVTGAANINYIDTPISGEFSTGRENIQQTSAGTSGVLYLSFRRATKTETITRITLTTGTTAAGATPTLSRMGIYSVNESTLECTLVGSCANDTTLFVATGTSYTRNLSASYTKTAGVLYGYGVLVVTTAALPSFIGVMHANINGVGNIIGQIPPISGALTSQSDLPATFTYTVALGNSRNATFWVRPA